MASENSGEIAKLIKALINQQFYNGSDKIYGRTKEVSAKIEGAGLAIHKLYAKILSLLSYFQSKNYFGLIKEFNEIVLPIQMDRVYTKFRDSYDNAAALEEPEEFLVASMLFSEILQNSRDKIFNQFLSEMKDEIIVSKKNKINDPNKVTEALKTLFSRNDKDISLAYNLVFLRLLAIEFEFPDVLTRVENILNKKKASIMRKIIRKGSKLK